MRQEPELGALSEEGLRMERCREDLSAGGISQCECQKAGVTLAESARKLDGPEAELHPEAPPSREQEGEP